MYYFLLRSLKFQWVTKIFLIFIFFFFFVWLFWLLKLCLCEFTGQRLNYCKTLWVQNEVSKTPWGKEQRLNKYAGQICLQSLPHGVMESLFFAPRSFGAMQPLPRKLVSQAKITMKISYSAFSKGNIINFYNF